MDLIVLSDLSAGLIAAGWSSAHSYGHLGSNTLKAIAISIVARLASDNMGDNLIADTSQKNQLVVFALGLINGYVSGGKKNIFRFGLEQSATDLLGTEILKLLKQDPAYALFSTKALPVTPV
jgi:hypothetical protein